MEKNIIVPIDFSDISKDVALYADQSNIFTDITEINGNDDVLFHYAPCF